MPSLEKALVTNLVTEEDVEVLFNPEELTLSKENNFAQMNVHGLGSPLLQFLHGSLATLQMELLVDSYESHRVGTRVLNQAGSDVRALTSRITGLLGINSDTHAPPVLLFAWGSVTFKCVLAKVSERLIMFLPSGIPVRARLQVTFNEFTNADLEAKEKKLQTADYSHVHVVAEGETLSAIAFRVYKNAASWRPIALRNRIEDPRRLTVGASLLVPRLPFRDPETGEVTQ